jgi:hypothetical protein
VTDRANQNWRSLEKRFVKSAGAELGDYDPPL